MNRLAIHRRVLRFAPFVPMVIAAAACGPRRQGPSQPPTAIVFSNESIDQATVYVVAPGRDFRRIGTVLAGRTDTLTVPSDMANRGAVNIVARLLARPEVPQTGPVSIRPGELYQVRLANDARMLSFLPEGS